MPYALPLPRAESSPPARAAARSILRNGAVPAGLGLVAAYAYGTAKYRRLARTTYDLRDPPAPDSDDFVRLLAALSGASATTGNRVTVLRNGRGAFPTMVDAIRSATTAVDLSSYIYWPGAVADEFTEALAERAQAGVDVNVVLDGWGSAKAKAHRDMIHRLESAGVRLAFFRTPHWHTVHKLNNRMHRRLLIVDGRIAFAGGVGIADMWSGDAEDPEHWRETHLAVEGPAALDIFGGFLENWSEATKTVLGPAHYPKQAGFEDGIELQVMRSSPKAGGTVALHLFHALMAGAQERLWITTAFLAPGKAFVDHLIAAAERGVDVRLLTNGPHIDKEVVRQVGQRCYGPLLAAGVRIFEYQQTMLHAKVVIADGWANVGSSNLDHRSLGLDDELNLATRDPSVVAELADQFLDDLEVSTEFDLDRWRQRSLAKRATEATLDLLRQSL